MATASTTHKVIYGITERGEGNNKKSYWTRIGVAFENKDGSFNMRFDFIPTSPDTTIQMRDPREKDDE